MWYTARKSKRKGSLMEDVLAKFALYVNILVGVLALFATIEIFYIASTLNKILAAVKSADARRRKEFEAMSAPDGE